MTDKSKEKKEMKKTGKLNTDRLNSSILHFKNENQISKIFPENEVEYTLSEYLAHLLETYDVKKKEVIAKSQLDTIYGYQIFQGKKNPSRNVLICLCFGFGLSVDDAKRLLYYGGVASLYPRVKRDAYIMFALNKKMDVIETNELLYSHEQETIC
ncbi:MAG: XRE family transcriptional regulator [Lachnospiraceae bacterium]|nr:XRE family transcriptional regulator [Lachnospiraceae bacterium]